jgi:hypothetical protein
MAELGDAISWTGNEKAKATPPIEMPRPMIPGIISFLFDKTMSDYRLPMDAE